MRNKMSFGKNIFGMILVYLVGFLAISTLGTGCACGGGFPIPELPEKVVGKCNYTNSFAGTPECKDYLGNWSQKEAVDDCKSNDGVISLDTKCGIAEEKRYGSCIFIIDKEKDKFARVELPGTDSSKCTSMQRGCEFFGGGSFVPTPVCGGKVEKIKETVPIFQQPTKICKEPKKGEPAGKGPNGQVCTWSSIAGATEEGRNFADYGNCDSVRSQRPYFPMDPEAGYDKADPRMENPEYKKENEWVRKQITASACMCCHTKTAPKGPSNWYIEAGPNWVNSMGPRGLAMGAGWINTVSFGAYHAKDNNGFVRADPENPDRSAFPSTDDARMRRFFEAELKRLGKTKEDFKNEKYATGPMETQFRYKATDCKTDSQDILADGTIKWVGGAARYLYILEKGSTPPTVPPNLDLPKGTIWRIDIDSKSKTLLESGKVKFGEVPSFAKQKFPADGAPPKLVPGKKYYLYVLRDVIVPITRCYITAK